MKIIFWDDLTINPDREKVFNQIQIKNPNLMKATTNESDKDLLDCIMLFEHNPDFPESERQKILEREGYVIQYSLSKHDSLSSFGISAKTLFNHLEKFINSIKNKNEILIKDLYILYNFNPVLESKLIIYKLLHKCLRGESNTTVFSEIDSRLQKAVLNSDVWEKWKRENMKTNIDEASIEDLWKILSTQI